MEAENKLDKYLWKQKKVEKLTQNIYTTHSHTDILSIITVLKICLSLRAIETRVYILEKTILKKKQANQQKHTHT